MNRTTALPRSGRRGRRAVLLLVLSLVLPLLPLPAAGTPVRPAPVVGGPGLAPLPQVAAVQSPATAVSSGVAQAQARGVRQYVSVIDRSTGAVLSETANARSQVASESIMKLLLAAYYLVLYGGYNKTPADVRDRLAYMLEYSDDGTANSLFTSSAIPSMAARYGMTGTTNATDRVGHWGAARITARDMTTFLYRASKDPLVGPWLIPVMARTTALGSDGFNQDFGLNALTGVHGSKQGWGNDSFWTTPSNAMHSVGYTDRYFVAVLTLAASYADPARATATTTARLVQASRGGAVRDGEFIRVGGFRTIYRVAGGAPIPVSAWATVGGVQPVRVISTTDFAALNAVPADGTFLSAGRTTYRVAGGAPIVVSSWTPFGAPRSTIRVDPAAISRAGIGGDWNHLRPVPADGTFVNAGGTVYRIAGGAPIVVSSWTPFGGVRAATQIDPAAVRNAGIGGDWNHLRRMPADGTFLNAGGTVFRVAGGAPIVVSSWTTFGGVRAATQIDPAAVRNAGRGGDWNHLQQLPADGTFLNAAGTVFRVAGGAPLYVSSWAELGGVRPATQIDPVAVSRAGIGGDWNHLRFHPADGTFLQARPSGTIVVVNGGAARYVPSWEPYGGVQPVVAINQRTIELAGTGGAYDHLRKP
ncbi:hypothetical protein GIS00_05955 [Nakamurella sp. YIM 132087]|uniref:Uncharacterized protein n=1 Tax=Nakamurella alba TaxID=2665158 RepID=A0A7K1FHE5_9ACTN|nr:hypothetical protein [Nakamurella alba]MTD13486.1 hypothetical protein [Nakamurella alba]